MGRCGAVVRTSDSRENTGSNLLAAVSKIGQYDSTHSSSLSCIIINHISSSRSVHDTDQSTLLNTSIEDTTECIGSTLDDV